MGGLADRGRGGGREGERGTDGQRGGGRERHVEPGVGDHLLTRRADVAPRLVEALHEIAVALLDAGAKPADVGIAGAHHDSTRLRPGLQQGPQLAG